MVFHNSVRRGDRCDDIRWPFLRGAHMWLWTGYKNHYQNNFTLYPGQFQNYNKLTDK